MNTLEVKVEENGHIGTYEPPQLIGVEITETDVMLSFDPIHSDTEQLIYNRDELIGLEMAV